MRKFLKLLTPKTTKALVKQQLLSREYIQNI